MQEVREEQLLRRLSKARLTRVSSRIRPCLGSSAGLGVEPCVAYSAILGFEPCVTCSAIAGFESCVAYRAREEREPADD